MTYNATKNKKIIWSCAFAYAIGLIATDGNLSKDNRHINFTSKDLELILNMRVILKKNITISKKARGGCIERKYYVLQFSDVKLYHFLNKIGLKPNKSKTINKILIPRKYFYDFLRGCIDGDGNINIYFHPESKLPQLRVRIISASKLFLDWINSVTTTDNIKGYICRQRNCYVLHYAKYSSIDLLNKIYYPGFRYCLNRKFKKVQLFLNQ